MLSKLSKFVNAGSPDYFATMLCVRVDIAGHRATIASAGHLPPLLIADGEAKLLEFEPDMAIGVTRNWEYHETEVSVPPHAILIAYTDGLVERRGELLDDGPRAAAPDRRLRTPVARSAGGKPRTCPAGGGAQRRYCDRGDPMADLSQPAELRVETSNEQPGVAVVSVSGELDVSNAETLESAIAQVCEGRPEELVFDLRELSFMDSAGIAVLLGGARRVPSVRLRDPTPAVRRVVEVTGLTTVLRLGDA